MSSNTLTELPTRHLRRAALSLAMTAFALVGAAANAAQPMPLSGSGLSPIGDNVYLEGQATPETKTRLADIVEQAKAQAAQFYGGLTANPAIMICTSVDRFRKSGGVGLGYSDGENILISPYGGRAAIVSHELSHVELATRLGGFSQVLAKVPQWFDEGLAVYLSQAPEFSEDAWLKATQNGKDSPPLRELEGLNDWNRLTGEDGANMQLTYGTAKREVARWYAKVGREGLDQLIHALRQDENFHVAYRRIENSADSSANLRIASRF